MNPTLIGIIFVGVGVSFSAYHLSYILRKKARVQHTLGIIFGVLFINMGSNLLADSIRDKALKGKP